MNATIKTEREFCHVHGYTDHFDGRVFDDGVEVGHALHCPQCFPTHVDNPFPTPEPAIDMRHLRVLRESRHSGRSMPSPNTLFIPLPRELWRPVGTGCSCQWCCEHPDVRPYWDTLAVARDRVAGSSDTTWLVHMPEAHG